MAFNYEKGATARKIVFLALACGLAWMGGREFLELRNFKEQVVVSESFTEKKMLSDWFPPAIGVEIQTG